MNNRTSLSRSAAALAICLCATHAAASASPARRLAAGTNLPPTVQITCPTPSPLFEHYVLPSLRVVWVGHDPDGPGTGTPVEYKYLLLGPSSEFPVSLAIADPDSLRRYYAHHPLGPWTGWSSTGPATPSATFTNLITGEHYLFVVIAFDQAGDYSPVFTLSSNMLQFVVSFNTGYRGPVITMTGPGLDYTYPTGGYCACPSAEVPVDVPEHRPTTFQWSANATMPCDHDGLRSYRWSLDIEDLFDQTPRIDEQTDLSHWSAPSLGTTSATLPPFTLANPPTTEMHRLYIEAADDVGLKSLGIILITVVPSTNGSPECHAAAADPPSLWPPNHKLVPVSIEGVSDPDGDPVTFVVTRVTQDEPVQNSGSDDHARASDGDGNGADLRGVGVENLGHLGDDPSAGGPGDDRRGCVDAVIDPDSGLRLRAERDASGNGRVYRVWFTATDGQGGSCDGSVQVCVPRDRNHPACVDDGGTFDSFGPCRGSGRDDGHLVLEVAAGSQTSGRRASVLRYSLPVAGEVLVAVYDVTGRHVTTLVNEYRTAGAHQAVWNHDGAAQGMYFARLRTPSGSLTKAMMVLK
jgi:hypothetical protein